MGASFRNTRAMATRCASPPDRYVPPGPMRVSRPSGRRATTSSMHAARAAASTSSRVAASFPMRMFASSVSASKKVSWNTNDTVSERRWDESSRTSTPPTRTEPSSASKNRRMSAAMVDLPPPEGPTRPVMLPEGSRKLTSSSARGPSGPAYEKDTWENSTLASCGSRGSAGSARSG